MTLKHNVRSKNSRAGFTEERGDKGRGAGLEAARWERRNTESRGEGCQVSHLGTLGTTSKTKWNLKREERERDGNVFEETMPTIPQIARISV